MITDHKWRPMSVGPTKRYEQRGAQAACQYLNCRRPAAEHATQVVLPVRGGMFASKEVAT